MMNTMLNLFAPSASLAWLADAPAFSDAEQVGSFYHAIMRPEAARGATEITLTDETAQKMSGTASAGLKVSLDTWMRLCYFTSNCALRMDARPHLNIRR
ncbi:MAG TPA: hypothetical protein VFB38_12595 [Chthonomonadaceae bacterium]|nr:hypothetical protein [Chthonomonadaceae bacterium]